MKFICSVVALAALVGCAGTNRPTTGPGSGFGAAYVPDVKPTATAASDYDATLGKCQRWARDLPYTRTGQHDGALAFIGFASGFAFGYTTPLVGIDFFAATTVGAAGYGGFGYWVEAPERQNWYAKQETLMVNCMTMSGYENNDPSVKVTYVKHDSMVQTVRKTGVDTYGAERLAKARSCGTAPLADMVAKGPGFESYRVACPASEALAIRCEFGNCRILR
ncbi:MAG: hypothetical protein JWQ73_3485 [Variovorax sp.]|jgi:hypothetical protein|nr:hypothetical protein [Variovorax sp.]